MTDIGDPVEQNIEFTVRFLGVLNKHIPVTSPYHCDELHITEREMNCLISIIKSLELAMRNENHISKILVGLKGVGKTTLYALCFIDVNVIRIQTVCSTLGYFFKDWFITYYDVTRDPKVQPINVLHAALRLRGDRSHFLSVSALASYIRQQGFFMLTVFDEAEKYYLPRTAPEKEYGLSREAVGQLYELGMQKGSVVILCGSSSTLVDLALKRNMTSIGKTLAMNYYEYPDLNQQKFQPLVLPLVKFEDVSGYLRV